MKLQGLFLPFLNRVSEISRENPEAIPQEVMGAMEEVVEEAARTAEEKASNMDLVPDELDSTIEKPVTGTIQVSTPATTTAPPVAIVVPSDSGGSSSGSGDITPDPVVPEDPEEPGEPGEPGEPTEPEDPEEPQEPEVNKDDLENVLAEVAKYDGSDYEEGWQAFVGALSVALDVRDNAGATQAEVDSALEALQAAIRGLVPWLPSRIVTTYEEMLAAVAASEVTEIIIDADITVPAVADGETWSIEIDGKELRINEGETLTLAENSRMAYDTIVNEGDIVIKGSLDNRGYLQGGNILGSGIVSGRGANLSIDVDSEEALRNALRFQTESVEISILTPLVINNDLDVPRESGSFTQRIIHFYGEGSLVGGAPEIELILYSGDSIHLDVEIMNQENNNFYYYGGDDKITGLFQGYEDCLFTWQDDKWILKELPILD